MPAPITERFEHLTLEVSDDGTTWAKLCGLVDVTVNRSTTFDTSEVPADCDDESLPLTVERAARSQEVTVSANGAWAAQSHGTMLDWWYDGTTKMVRIGNQNAAVGDTQYEQGPAFLTSLGQARAKGQKVSATVEVAFDGRPTRIAKV